MSEFRENELDLWLEDDPTAEQLPDVASPFATWVTWVTHSTYLTKATYSTLPTWATKATFATSPVLQ
jgi:hypothetical protein